MDTGTWKVKTGLAQMLKGGVIMDVVTPDQAKIAENAAPVQSWRWSVSRPI
jgi:pyridoxal 5'-phosphate synthase pdxS subunit